MKILIKTYKDVYKCFEQKKYMNHCASYYPFLFREIFRQLGHQCDFIGPKIIETEIVNEFDGYDVLFYWGLESYEFDWDYAFALLKGFKGKKVLYITTQWCNPIIKEFNYIFATDVKSYIPYYQKEVPTAKSIFTYFASPIFGFIDDCKSVVFPELNSYVTYIGIILPSYITILNKIAESGISLTVGGEYFPPKEQWIRPFTEREIKTLFHPSIKFYSKNGSFEYGEHWKFLRQATLGLNFFPNATDENRACNSKIIDYLVCGLPVISEHGSPNAYHINDFNAGIITPSNDINKMIESIKCSLTIKWDRQEIQRQARERFNPLTIGQQILDTIK